MKKVKLSSTDIINVMGASNATLIRRQTIKSLTVPDSAGYILLLALNQPTGGHSGIIAFGRAYGHMGSSYTFHIGNYVTTIKTKWPNSGVAFYSVKKNGVEYIAVKKDAANVLVQLITFYGSGLANLIETKS